MIYEYRGYDQDWVNEIGQLTWMSPEEKRAYYVAREEKEKAREGVRKREEREERARFVAKQLTRMGYPVTSITRGIITIDFNDENFRR
jgi:hypothetical protein